MIFINVHKLTNQTGLNIKYYSVFGIVR
jgi:hypothetical protein